FLRMLALIVFLSHRRRASLISETQLELFPTASCLSVLSPTLVRVAGCCGWAASAKKKERIWLSISLPGRRCRLLWPVRSIHFLIINNTTSEKSLLGCNGCPARGSSLRLRPSRNESFCA